MKKILLTILFCLICSLANATEYFVRLDGNDTDCTGLVDAAYPGSGTAQPCAFLTMQKGVDSATAAGDIVTFGDGTYTEGFSNSADATGTVLDLQNITNISRSDPAVITVPGHGFSNGDYVTVDGLDETTGMDQLAGRIYTIANVTTNTFQLVGEDSTDYVPYASGGWVRKIIPIIYRAKNPGQVIIDQSVEITGWDGTGQPSYTYLSSATPGGTSSVWKSGRTQFLISVSSPGAVDAENEFYRNTSTNTYLIYTTADPNTFTYKSATAGDSIRVEGVSGIILDGIMAKYDTSAIFIGYNGASSLGNGTSFIFLKNMMTEYTASLGGIVFYTSEPRPSSYLSCDGCIIRWNSDAVNGTNGHGIKFGANFNSDNGTWGTFANGIIEGTYAHGVQFSNGWVGGRFYNNRIYDNGYGTFGGSGIRCGQGHAPNESCVIHDNNIGGGVGGVGLSPGGGVYIQDGITNTRMYRNLIHDVAFTGLFVFVTSDTEGYPYNNYVYNNIFYNCVQSAIRIDENDSIYIFNNTMEGNGTSSANSPALNLADAAAQGVAFMNNIISTDTRNVYSIQVGATILSDFNTLYVADGSLSIRYHGVDYDLAGFSALTGNDTHSTALNPQFVDPLTHDYNLTSISPARMTARNLSDYFNRDYVNRLRGYFWDMGAYENSSEVVLQGVRIN